MNILPHPHTEELHVMMTKYFVKPSKPCVVIQRHLHVFYINLFQFISVIIDSLLMANENVTVLKMNMKMKLKLKMRIKMKYSKFKLHTQEIFKPSQFQISVLSPASVCLSVCLSECLSVKTNY